MVPVIHEAAHLLTLRVIQSLAEGSVIGGAAAVLLRSFRQSAGARFAVWFSSLMAIAAMPFLSSGGLWHIHAESSANAAVTLPDSWALYVLAAWAATAVWFLLGVGRSLLDVRKLRKSCVEVTATSLDPAIQETLLRHRGSRRIALCTSTQVRVPSAVGLMKPVVVIPEWLMRELSTEELNQILLHELAHLRRWDDWTNLAQQLVKCVFFFHPVVWWIEKKVALEREMACDDAVLAETKSPRSYATCLASLAEKTLVHRSIALAQAALGRVRQTTERITRILDPNRAVAENRMLKPALSLIAVLGLGCGVWSARTSNLIAFEEAGPESSVSAAVSDVPAGMQVPAVFHSYSHALAVRPTNLKLEKTPSTSKVKESARPRLANHAQHPERLIHLAKAVSEPLPVSETVFVVIENHMPESSNDSGYQIQLWRVTVLRTVTNPAQTSRKQI